MGFLKAYAAQKYFLTLSDRQKKAKWDTPKKVLGHPNFQPDRTNPGGLLPSIARFRFIL